MHVKVNDKYGTEHTITISSGGRTGSLINQHPIYKYKITIYREECGIVYEDWHKCVSFEDAIETSVGLVNKI